MKNRNSEGPSRTRREGFTLVELFFVIIILAVLIGMLLPGMRTVREPARRAACLNNQKNLALACLNFESTHMRFPAMRGVMQNGMLVGDGNAAELSGMVTLLPYLEQSALCDQIATARTVGGIAYPAWGPPTTDRRYEPWQTLLPMLQCPAIPNNRQLNFGGTNYAFSMGDLARDLHEPKQLRGLFGGNLTCRKADLIDGTSNTLAFAEMGGSSDRRLISNYAIKQSEEILNDPSLILAFADYDGKKFADSVELGAPSRGGHWAAGEPCINGFNTILPPNSPSAKVAGRADGIFSAGSFHVGLVVVAYADGSTHAIPDGIDCGDSTAATPRLNEEQIPSPYGIWGALGTLNGGEIIDYDRL